MDKHLIGNKHTITYLLIFSFFLGSNLISLLIPYIFQILFFLIFIIFIITFKSNFSSFRRMDEVLLLLVLYQICTVFSGFTMTGVVSIYEVLKKITSLLLVMYIIINFNHIEAKIAFCINAHLVLFMAIAGIFGFALDYFGFLPSLAVRNIGSRYYDYKLLLFQIQGSDSFVQIFGKSLYRLQGFFDEPGSFAFVLLLAIVYFIGRRRVWSVAILSIALILTFSLGAFITLLGITLIYIVRTRKTKKLIKILFILSLIIFIALILYMKTGNEWLKNYISMKFGIGSYEGSFSSFSSRENEYILIFKTLVNFPFGCDVESAFNLNNAYFSSGIISDLTMYGITAFFIRLSLEIFIVSRSIVALGAKRRSVVISAFAVLVMILMGYQRMSFLRTYYMTIFIVLNYLFLRYSDDSPTV